MIKFKIRNVNNESIIIVVIYVKFLHFVTFFFSFQTFFGIYIN